MIFKGGRARDEDVRRQAFKNEALSHMETLYSAALYMTRDPGRAEDLVQDTYLKAYRFWDQYQAGTNCKAWLFRILTNTYINRNRRKPRLHVSFDDLPMEIDSTSMAEGSRFYQTPDAHFLRELFPEHVQRALESLPDSFRLPVILADLQDFSYKEIADIMDCPVGTVMSRLFRGRQRLQEALFEYAVETGIIPRQAAVADDGTLSLEAYRKRRAAAGT
jgi:RNA polymerase sigma-70 factor (ECF subfamily)